MTPTREQAFNCIALVWKYFAPETADVIKKYITHLEANQQPQWQPIETAPKDGTNIVLTPLGFGHRSHASFVGYWVPEVNGFAVQHVGHMHGLAKPTHWMPLPEPPEGTWDDHTKI